MSYGPQAKRRNDEAHAVALDSGDDVITAGFTVNARTGRDMVKLGGAQGGKFWRPPFP